MRLPRVLLLVSAATGAFAVLATLFSETRAALQSSLVAAVAFLGYVLLAGPAPGVRRALAAGIGLFAAVMALKLWWLPEPPADAGWLIPFYAPLDGGAPVDLHLPARLDHLRQTIEQDRIAAVGLLLGVLCLAVAVLALPVQHRPRRTLLARVVAVLLLVVVAVDVGDRVNDAPLLGAFGVGWSALLATLAAAGMLAAAGRRSDRFVLVPLGALLIAGTAAADFAGIISAWSSWWSLTDASRDAFLSVGVAGSVGGWTDVSAAVQVAMALAGPTLLALGALHASRDTSAADRQ
ncbi:hypothetical protein [Micromonospora sp. SL4-19]|uniref:hypothetical protein n=1 Tax=Micromonospora sp. SL4-19 TaxID=3399129 RepID=UPI003A4D59B7